MRVVLSSLGKIYLVSCGTIGEAMREAGITCVTLGLAYLLGRMR